jgi:hypothetical protein
MPSLSKEPMGDNTCEALKKLTFPLNKASTDCITFYRISPCKLYLMKRLCIYV